MLLSGRKGMRLPLPSARLSRTVLSRAKKRRRRPGRRRARASGLTSRERALLQRRELHRRSRMSPGSRRVPLRRQKAPQMQGRGLSSDRTVHNRRGSSRRRQARRARLDRAVRTNSRRANARTARSRLGRRPANRHGAAGSRERLRTRHGSSRSLAMGSRRGRHPASRRGAPASSRTTVRRSCGRKIMWRQACLVYSWDFSASTSSISATTPRVSSCLR